MKDTSIISAIVSGVNSFFLFGSLSLEEGLLDINWVDDANGLRALHDVCLMQLDRCRRFDCKFVYCNGTNATVVADRDSRCVETTATILLMSIIRK